METKSDDVDDLIATIWRRCPWEGLSHGKTVSKKQVGGAGDTYGYLLYNCEVSRDWRFQPLLKQGEMQLEEASFRDK